MVNSMYQLCMTRYRDIAATDGHAMPCAPTLSALATSFGGAIVPLSFQHKGICVPISRGGPPALKE